MQHCFSNNHLIQNQLDEQYLEAVLKVGMLYGLFERDNSRAEKGIVEVVQIDKKGWLYQNVDLPHTVLDDSDYFEFTIRNSRENKEDSFEHENISGMVL